MTLYRIKPLLFSREEGMHGTVYWIAQGVGPYSYTIRKLDEIYYYRFGDVNHHYTICPSFETGVEACQNHHDHMLMSHLQPIQATSS